MKELKITIHFVKEPHPATFVENKPPIGKLLYRAAVWISVAEKQAPLAVVAYHKGKIIGILKYCMKKKTLHACGTIVDRRFRQKGVATRLWQAVIKKHKPRVIDVAVSTNEGMKLVKTLRYIEHPEINFIVHDYIS